jgi:hypothetical protein
LGAEWQEVDQETLAKEFIGVTNLPEFKEKTEPIDPHVADIKLYYAEVKTAPKIDEVEYHALRSNSFASSSSYEERLKVHRYKIEKFWQLDIDNLTDKEWRSFIKHKQPIAEMLNVLQWPENSDLHQKSLVPIERKYTHVIYREELLWFVNELGFTWDSENWYFKGEIAKKECKTVASNVIQKFLQNPEKKKWWCMNFDKINKLFIFRRA